MRASAPRHIAGGRYFFMYGSQCSAETLEHRYFGGGGSVCPCRWRCFGAAGRAGTRAIRSVKGCERPRHGMGNLRDARQVPTDEGCDGNWWRHTAGTLNTDTLSSITTPIPSPLLSLSLMKCTSEVHRFPKSGHVETQPHSNECQDRERRTPVRRSLINSSAGSRRP